MSTSKLLIDEDPIMLLPSLAVAIGLNEAIFIQQLHYWMRIAEKTNSGKLVNGRRWVYKTLADWKSQNFPFWSERTIQTIISNLREIGAIDVEALAMDSRDRTNFYSINYDFLRSHDAEVASSDDAEVASWSTQELRPPNKTETTTETTTEKGRRTRSPAADRSPAVVIELPDWIPQKPWADFVAMRASMGASGKLTARAAELILSKLEDMREAGQDIAAVLEQSVMNNWRSVFPVKPSRLVGGPASKADREKAEIDAFVNGSPDFDPNVIDMEVPRVGFR